MNKKNNIILIIAIVLLISIIIFLIINNSNYKGELKEITWANVQKKIEKKEDFVLVLSQTTCSHCAQYKPTLKEVTKNYEVTIYYLDYDKYDEEEIKEILNTLNYDGDTPTTFFFKEGSEISLMSRIIGAASKTKVIETLKKYEYIKES